MPYWWVSEPRLTVWLRDKPFFYKTSRGEEVSFALHFRNSTGPNGIIDSAETAIFGVGTNWNTPWRSYVKQLDGIKCLVVLGNGSAKQYVLGITDYATRATLIATGQDEYVLTLSSGVRYSFEGAAYTLGETTYSFLTGATDASGLHSMHYTYKFTNNCVLLAKFTDYDQKETALSYTNVAYYSSLISSVTGPYGQNCTLTYNASGQLIQITDMAGLQSQMEYDSSNRIAKLTTPYGTNTFAYSNSSSGWKMVLVSEHGVKNHLYLGDYITQGAFASAYSEYQNLAQVLQSANLSQTFETNGFDERNTLYWGPRQYDNLPQSIRSSLTNGTFTPVNLTTNEFQLGRMRHWLKRRGGTLASDSLALERGPSQRADGASEGLYTWFDYAEKKNSDRTIEGKMRLPLCVASREPGAPWRVKHTVRNSYGLVITLRETYGDTADTLWWRTHDYTYDANGLDLTLHRVRASGWWGNSTNDLVGNVYNGNRTLSYSSDAAGHGTWYAYDTSQRLTHIQRESGLGTEYLYDENGFVGSIMDYFGFGFAIEHYTRTNSYTYTNGNVLTHTDPRGVTITNTWDALGRLVRVSYPDGTFITNTYDKLDLVQVVDRMGLTNRYERNDFGEVIRHLDALGNTNSYDYCTCGVLDSMTDAMGNTTSYVYDNNGRLVSTVYPGGSGITNTYNMLGQPVIVSDSAGSVTNIYVIQGLLSESRDAAGIRMHQAYDFRDFAIQVTNRNGVSYSQEFDGLGRVTARYSGDGVEWYEYFFPNEGGEVVFYYDQLYRLTEQYSDEIGRRTKVIRYSYNPGVGFIPLSTNSYTYSPAGDLLSLTDEKGQVTTWQYDQYGQVTNKTDAANNVLFRYQYDANSRLTNRWTPGQGGSGITTRYQYDGNGNLTQVAYGNWTNTLAYDANNRLTNMLDAAGTTRYTYTVFGAIASEDGPWDTDAVSYSYNNDRQRSGLTLQQPGGSLWAGSYGYDTAGRLTSVNSPAGEFGYTYDATAKDLVGRVLLPNGAYITNTYDSMARWTATSLKSSSHAILNAHSYTYNAAHERTRQTRTDGNYVNYTYDGLGQLVGADGRETGGGTRSQEQFKYQYDGAGNLAKRTNNALVQTFNVNNLNELTSGTRSGTYTVAGGAQGSPTSVTVNGQTATLYADKTFAKTGVSLTDGTNTFTAIATDSLSRYDTNTVTAYLPATVTFAYDLNGNLRTNGTRLFDYDDENQLIRVTEPGAWKSDFVYDGKMRRRERWESVWQNGAWATNLLVRYVYDGNLVLQERHYNPQLSTLIPQQLVTYTRGKDLSGSLEGAGGIGGLLARTEGPSALNSQLSTSFYHSDGNGNVTCLMATNQTVVARYLYDPFGNLLASSGPLAEANLYRFSSKEWHAAAGLVYYGYRFYDPSLQRWVNRDPIGEHGGINLCSFAANNPISKVDLLGLAVGPQDFVGLGQQAMEDLIRSTCMTPQEASKIYNQLRKLDPRIAQDFKKAAKMAGARPSARCRCSGAGLAFIFAVDALMQEIPDPVLPDQGGKCPGHTCPVRRTFLFFEWIECVPCA